MSNHISLTTFSSVKWIVIISYFIGLILDSMLQALVINFPIPHITLLLLFYWTIKLQNQTHLLTAFLLGILSDALFSTTLGAHAVLFSLLVFIILRSRLQFKSFPNWQQTAILIFYLFLFQVLGLFLFDPTFSQSSLFQYFLSPLWAILLWPLMSRLLDSMTFSASARH